MTGEILLSVFLFVFVILVIAEREEPVIEFVCNPCGTKRPHTTADCIGKKYCDCQCRQAAPIPIESSDKKAA